ncbi:hypothetical protein AGR1A_pAt20630 [Agrobacterium fabacearum CFBP 5771]|nr:hypothetical protein AGR1A_pAt20630 [Agrobacterium fabacearum CFBP 5771]
MKGTRDASSPEGFRSPSGGVMAIKKNLTLGRFLKAGKTVHEGRLACAVRTDQADNLVTPDRQRHIRDRGESLKAHREIVYGQLTASAVGSEGILWKKLR